MTDFVKMRELIRQEERYRWAVEKQMAKATKITSSLSKSGRSGSGRTGSQVEDGAVELAPLKEEYAEIKEELDAMKAELRISISKLRAPRYRLDKTCLRMRYIQGISVRKIAVMLNYHEQYLFRKMREAEDLITMMQQRAESRETR